MGVAQVVHSLDPGGTEKLVLDLTRRSAASYPTRVYCLDGQGQWAAKLTQQGIPIHVLGRRPGLDLGVAWRLSRLAASHRIGVLHCHQYSPFVYGSLAALVHRRLRVVFTEHGRLSEAPPSHRRARVNPWLGRVPAMIAAVSEELRLFMVAEGFAGQRVRVIYNGIDPGPASTDNDRANARALMELPAEAVVVGTAARLDPVKNLLMAIEAVAELRRTVPGAVLVVIGDGPEGSDLKRAAERHSGFVSWLGYRDDVRRLLPGMDIFLNTSLSEGVSITILEAMAAGLPVVATAVGGTPEVVLDESTGLLVPSGDVAGCRAVLERLSGDPQHRHRLGQAGRDRVMTTFSLDRMLADYMTAYAGV